MFDKLRTMNCMGHGPNQRNSLTLLAVWVSRYMIFSISPRIANALVCLSMRDSQIGESDQVGVFHSEQIFLPNSLERAIWPIEQIDY